ncbi:MAG: DUF3488 domain-containing protein, partial [Holophagales bacterium]|nr:DUF3488 domain-containing protein [Holophagales bacterium]
MTINVALRITTLFQVAAGGLALVLAGSETALSGAAVLFIVALAGLVGRNWPIDETRRKRFWNTLALFSLALFIAEFVSHRQLLPAVVRLVVFLSAYKLFTLQGHRDYFTVYMLSFLQLLAATSISYDYYFALPYVLFVIFSCMALVLLTIKSGKEREQATRSLLTGLPEASTSPSVPMKKMPGAILIALAVLLITGAIFPFLPRIRTDVMGSTGGEQMQILSGFSHVIALEAMSDIKTNPEVVMRVSLEGDERVIASRPKLRGIVLSMFDGLRWTHTFAGGRRVNQSSDGRYYFGDRSDGTLLKQNIQLHPLNTRSIFAAALPESAQGPFG